MSFFLSPINECWTWILRISGSKTSGSGRNLSTPLSHNPQLWARTVQTCKMETRNWTGLQSSALTCHAFPVTYLQPVDQPVLTSMNISPPSGCPCCDSVILTSAHPVICCHLSHACIHVACFCPSISSLRTRISYYFSLYSPRASTMSKTQ